MDDLLPPEVSKWQYVEERVRSVLDAFAFREVRPGGEGTDAERLVAAHARWKDNEEAEEVTRWYIMDDDHVTAAVLGVVHREVRSELEDLAAAVAEELSIEPQPFASPRSSANGLFLELDLAALVEAIEDSAESFQPPVAVLVGRTIDGPTTTVARELRRAGIRTLVEHRPAPADEHTARARRMGARLVAIIDGTGAFLRELDTKRQHQCGTAAETVAKARALLD